MSTHSPTARAALLQARAELRISFLTPAFLAQLIGPVLLVGILWFVMRDSTLPARGIGPGAFALVGALGAFGSLGAFELLSEMYTERTDGTLLRLRMVPGGTRSWMLGKTVSCGVVTLFAVLVSLVGGALVFPDLLPESPLRVLGLLAAVVVAYLVFLPFGAILGTLLRTAWGLMLAMLGFYAFFGASGTVFSPLVYPEPVQWLVAVTPFYWSAHVARWALLPADAGAAELTGTFQPLLGLGVLLVWAVVGYLLAPRVLLRGIRRETVGALTASRERIAQKGYV